MKKYGAFIFQFASKILLLPVFAIFLISCTSVMIETPVAQVEPPFIYTQKKWTWAVALEGSGRVSYSGLNERPPSILTEWSTGSMNSTNIQYAALPYLKIGLGGTIPIYGNTGYLARMSLGLPFESSFRVGIFAETLAISSKSTSGDQKNTFGAGGYSWKGTGSSSTVRTGVSVGYAIDPNVMTYLGYSRSNSVLKVKTEQAVATDDPGGTFERQDVLSSAAAGFGIQFGIDHSFFISGQRVWQNFLAESRQEDVARTGLELQF